MFTLFNNRELTLKYKWCSIHSDIFLKDRCIALVHSLVKLSDRTEICRKKWYMVHVMLLLLTGVIYQMTANGFFNDKSLILKTHSQSNCGVQVVFKHKNYTRRGACKKL